VLEGALLIVAGLLLLSPGYLFDVLGVGLALAALGLQLLRDRGRAATAALG